MNHIYQNIEGWFDFEEIYSNMVNKFESGSYFVEIGSWLGKSTSYMAVEIANSKKNIKFDCIDCWDGSIGSTDEEIYTKKINDLKTQDSTLYEEFLKNINVVKDYINPIKAYSYQVFDKYEDNSIDFLFIDGAHDYESVKNDLQCWFPKVKRNGIIAGHDYLKLDCPGVYNSVNEFFKNKNIQIFGTSWLVNKSDIKNLVIDTFIFYNELELLEFRLKELDEYVDYFVLVESKKAHSGNNKELYFDNNKNLFDKYLNKIIHIIDDDLESVSNVTHLDNFKNTPARIREENQRNSILKGLNKLDLNDEDIIIISDADEIINPNVIIEYINKDFNILALEQDFYFYNLNYKYPKIWTFPKVVKYKILKSSTPEDIRILVDGEIVKNGGWHFSYFFGPKNISDKIKNFSHQEFNNDIYTNDEYINNCIKNGEYIFDNVKLEYIEIENNKNLPKNYKILLNNKLININNFEYLDNDKCIKIYYEYFGDNDINIKISLKDLIFKTVEIFHIVNVTKGINYYSTFYPYDVHPYCNTHFTMGIDVFIYDNDNNELIYEKKLPGIKCIERPQLLPTFWVIGDSHVGNIFNNIESNLICDNFIINHVSHFLLSIKNFIRSDWKSFLKTIPIKEGDKISLLLGEIDLRIGILWKIRNIDNSEDRNKNLIEITEKLLDDYYYAIEDIKKIIFKL
jgi:beta-1,4-mannosyl-glycoprotein beta-1,4-N-acetylglucosaminyltransferase